MTSFIALYRGPSVDDARLIAVSSAPDLVAFLADQLLVRDEPSGDPVVEKLRRGRRSALKAVKTEAERFQVLLGGDKPEPEEEL
jgi:hypothetical protein